MRKANTKILTLVLAVCMVVSLVACGSPQSAESTSSSSDSSDDVESSSVEPSVSDGESESAASKGGFKIALSNSFIGNAWRSEMIKCFEATCRQKVESGEISEFYSSSSGNDAQAQINEIRNMISKGYDAILVDAASPTALAPICEEAVSRGIVVASFDNTVDSDKIYNVNCDQVESGRIKAQFIVDQMNGKGNVIIISGIEGTTYSRDHQKGNMEVLQPYIDKGDINLLGIGYGGWDEASVAVEINNMLAAYKSKGIDGIINEGQGEVAIYNALVQNNIDPTTIPMAGEYTNGFLRLIKDEGINGLAVGDPPYMVGTAVEIVLKVLNGETAEKMTWLPAPTADISNAAEHYLEGYSDNIIACWTDEDNSYNYELEEILPDTSVD